MKQDAKWAPGPNKTRDRNVIAKRLLELGTNPFKAALKVGLGRTYIYEYLTGSKKRSFTMWHLARFAEALDWPVSKLAAIVSG